MSKISSVLIDLSGTLHIEELAIPGAPAALELLRKHVHVKFVTNTTKESQNLLYQRVRNCGFQIEKHEIFTSLSAARDLIIRNKYRPFFILDDKAMEDFEGIPTEDPNAVLIGLAPEKFNDSTMTAAFRLIKEKNASLIAIHKGRYYQKKDGLHLGPGAYVSGLEYANGVEAKVVGKPEKLFFESALKTLDPNVDFSTAVMIGDDVNDDVLGAIKTGMRAILVKTGKFRSGDESKVKNVASSFVEAVNMIIENKVESD
uniref:Haloacid dehalogenase-like hydrolase domain-containing protein 2 n=1 Tax=Caenorhabditis tropicalis TaxID=1561998 RepID=A0A1I7UMW5_9PELO